MKRFLLQAAVVIAISAIAVAWVPFAALAKGPSQGIITGPGLAEPIRLKEPGATATGADLARVVALSAFFLGAWGDEGKGRLPHRPTGYLGPRYTITYTMGPHDPDTIVQYVYPFAEPAPITHMPPNQTYWGTNETVGAWYDARISLRRTLIRLGLPESSGVLLLSARDETSAATRSSDSWMAPVILVALAALGVAVAAALMRRRRAPGQLPPST